MYRVMLIDDEEMIVKGMSHAVPWEKYGCSICGTASDGVSGLEQIRTLKPDLLFTDICMPEMDGLALIAALRSEFPQIKVSILTGYRDFAYAQEAVRLGVTRLLTKPSRMADIEEAIVAMTQQLKDAPTEDEPEAVADEDQAASSFIVRQALLVLEEDYAEKLTLQTVAERCYVSQWHLSKLLNRHTSKSFYDLLNAVRIRHAKELLHEPKLRIADIGERIGYQDTAHFSRTFKKLEGISANEYRNSLSLS